MLTQWDWTGLLGGLISFAVVLYVQRTQRIRKSRGTTVSMIAFAGLVAYVWAPIGFPNSDWSRAPLGTDVIRLIPIGSAFLYMESPTSRIARMRSLSMVGLRPL